MNIEDTLVLTTPYYESGFNGKAWSLCEDPETDIFYYHIDSIPASSNLHVEIKSALQTIEKRFTNLCIIDDGSSEAKILRLLGPHLEVISSSEMPVPDQKFVDYCEQTYGLDDPEMLMALYFAYDQQRPLLCPRWEARVLNINFQRFSGRSLGRPYFVYVENEKFHKLAVAQKDLKVSLSWNFLKTSPELIRSYFTHPLMLNWLSLKSTEQAHNYLVERTIFDDVLQQLGGVVDADNERRSWFKSENIRTRKQHHPLQQASFPVHALFEKIFGLDLDINVLERKIYGSLL